MSHQSRGRPPRGELSVARQIDRHLSVARQIDRHWSQSYLYDTRGCRYNVPLIAYFQSDGVSVNRDTARITVKHWRAS